jgi:hypothetical protein
VTQPLTLTATISQSGAPLPVGALVRFFSGSTLIGSATVINDNGVAKATLNTTAGVPGLQPGTQLIRAEFAGDAVNYSSTSANVSLTVFAPSIAVEPTTLRPRPYRLDPVTIRAVDHNGQTLNLIGGSAVAIKVRGPLGGRVLGTGPVTFSNGQATFSRLRFTKIGKYVVKFRATLSTGQVLVTRLVFTVVGGNRQAGR